MPVAFRTASFVGGTGTNATPTEPSSAQQDDIFVALSLVAAAGTLAAPAGWTSLFSGLAGPSFDFDVSWVRRGASAPSLTWTTGGSVYREVYVCAFSGCRTSGSPVDKSNDAGRVNQNTDTNPPAVTPTDVNSDYVVSFAIDWNGSSAGWTQPAGYAQLSDDTFGNDGVVIGKAATLSATEDPGAITGRVVGASDQWTATITLTAAAEVLRWFPFLRT